MESCGGIVWRFIVGLIHSICDVVHSLALLPIVVAALVLRALLFCRIFQVLRLEVALQLAELGLDLVLAILADHFNRAKPFLSLPQFVLFLLLRASRLFHVDALVDAAPVPLPHLQVVLLLSAPLRTSRRRPTRIHHCECRSLHEWVSCLVAAWRLSAQSGRGLLVDQDGIFSTEL